MTAEKRDSGKGFGLRSGGRMEYDFSVKPQPLFRPVFCCLNGPGAVWQTWAFFGDRCKAGSPTARGGHRMHRAVMLAVPSAASGEIRLGIRDEQRRRQQPAE